MPKLTNMYYSQYASSTESEPVYDSDNTGTYKKLMQSPSQAEFRQYIERRNDEELLHESWKRTLHEQTNLAEKIKEQCGMAVNLKDNRVCYTYKPAFNNTVIPGMKFKITFMYIKLLRKWYISLGYSSLPDVVDLHNKLKRGTYDPTGPKVLELVRKVKTLLDIYVQRLIYTYQMINTMEDTYTDMEFQVNRLLTNVKVLLKEKAWPRSLEKTSPEDIIVLELTLDENLGVDNLAYEYIYSKDVSARWKETCITKLEKKLEVFFDHSLTEAFEIFMEEDSPAESEL